jgi:hypothetical protein
MRSILHYTVFYFGPYLAEDDANQILHGFGLPRIMRMMAIIIQIPAVVSPVSVKFNTLAYGIQYYKTAIVITNWSGDFRIKSTPKEEISLQHDN